MKLAVQSLSREAFAPFGQVVSIPQTEPTARLEGLAFWADVAGLMDVDGPYGLGVATQGKRSFVQTCAERHMKTPELLLPMGGDMIAVVGRPDYPDEPGRLARPERFAAFRVPEGDAIIMKPGVWHWAPFAVDAPVRLLVIFRAGTSQNDVTVVDFPPQALLELDL